MMLAQRGTPDGRADAVIRRRYELPDRDDIWNSDMIANGGG